MHHPRIQIWVTNFFWAASCASQRDSHVTWMILSSSLIVSMSSESWSALTLNELLTFSTWFIARQSSSFQQIILLSFSEPQRSYMPPRIRIRQFATVRCIIYIGTFSIWLYSICRTCESFCRLVGCQTRVTNRHGSPVSAGEHPSCFNW